jgi:hypothetical protein
MKSQDEPIANDEWLLRRVHQDNFSEDRTTIIPHAFRPQMGGRNPDVTGISFYRQDCLNSDREILEKTNVTKRQRYGIVRLPVYFLSSIGFSVIRDDDTELPIVLGHVVIPEINSLNYSQNKDVILARMKSLSDFVNESNEIILVPSS